ncbi:MAG: glycosyltransferase family 2 protein [Shewanella sp.]|uniref:glycosyltransferase family 2 protein n=1 Tax=Shewanella sp. TaxID=50422 RepID=UPI003001D7EE
MINVDLALSVIIPMFNAEHCIKRAIDSVYSALPHSQFEIIIVDDDSKDKSVAIVNGLKQQYSRLELHCLVTNSGAGYARNIGLTIAKSNYVMFIDADDYLLENTLELILNQSKKQSADVTLFPYKISNHYQQLSDNLLAIDKNIWSYLLKFTNTPHKLQTIPECLRLAGFPWNKIIKRSFAIKKKLQFSETQVLNDVFFHFQSLLESSNILLVNDAPIVHVYQKNTKQLTNIHDQRRIDSLVVLEQLNTLFSQQTNFEQFLPYLYAFENDLYSWMYKNATINNRKTIEKHYINTKARRKYNSIRQYTLSNKKFIVYGLGWKMMEHIDQIAINNSIVGFMDSDIVKMGKKVFNYEVFHPSQTILPDFDFILICSSYAQEIRENLHHINSTKVISIDDIEMQRFT